MVVTFVDRAGPKEVRELTILGVDRTGVSLRRGETEDDCFNLPFESDTAGIKNISVLGRGLVYLNAGITDDKYGFIDKTVN